MVLTLKQKLEGRFPQRLRTFKEEIWTQYRRQLNYHSDTLSYVWTVETGERDRLHLNLLVQTDLPVSELSDRWHRCRGGYENYAQEIDAEGDLLGVLDYISKEQFADAELGEDGFPGHRTNGHSSDLPGYRSEKARERQREYAREEALETLLDPNTDAKPVCDEEVLKRYLAHVLPNSIGKEVQGPDGSRGILLDWDECSGAEIWAGGQKRRFEPYDVLPIGKPLPELHVSTERRNEACVSKPDQSSVEPAELVDTPATSQKPNPEESIFRAVPEDESSHVSTKEYDGSHASSDDGLSGVDGTHSSRFVNNIILERSDESGAPDETPTIEAGTIKSVDREAGRAIVVTEQGREVRARIGTPMAGAGGRGLRVTPRAEARCLVVLLESGATVRPADAYLIATFTAAGGEERSWGAPGDFRIQTDRGGELLVAQSGLIDLKASNWARTAYMPTRSLVKTWAKSREALHTPLAHDRTIHDEAAERAFREVALNSRFLHGEAAQSPDVIQTWGRAEGSEQASALHPLTGFLLYRRAQHRQEGRPQTEFEERAGGPEGTIYRREAEDLQAGSRYVEEIVSENGTMTDRLVVQGAAETRERRGEGIAQEGEAVRREIAVEESSVVVRRGAFGDMLSEVVFEGEETARRQVYSDGKIRTENPEWEVVLEGDGQLKVTNGTTTVTIEDDEATIENGETSLTLSGANIYIGDSADSEQEPVAFGEASKKVPAGNFDSANANYFFATALAESMCFTDVRGYRSNRYLQGHSDAENTHAAYPKDKKKPEDGHKLGDTDGSQCLNFEDPNGTLPPLISLPQRDFVPVPAPGLFDEAVDNHGLFADHYLQGRFLEREDVQALEDEVESAMGQTEGLYRTVAPETGTWNEAQTEDNFVQPLLKDILGWSRVVQENVQRQGRRGRPDYALFTSEERRTKAIQRAQDTKATIYDIADAVADAKYWGRSLDGKAPDPSREKRSEMRQGNPSFQIIDYVTLTGVEWGILTNGARWRLYYEGAPSRLETYLEVNLPEICRLAAGNEEDRKEARRGFRLFYSLFRADAHRPATGGEKFVDVVYEASGTYAEELEDTLQERVFDHVFLELATGLYENHRRADGAGDPEQVLDNVYRATLRLLYRLLFLLYAGQGGCCHSTILATTTTASPILPSAPKRPSPVVGPSQSATPTSGTTSMPSSARLTRATQLSTYPLTTGGSSGEAATQTPFSKSTRSGRSSWPVRSSTSPPWTRKPTLPVRLSTIRRSTCVSSGPSTRASWSTAS
ncbi:hypothetical protein [Salinibacter sp.]|uniref:hypothetical protein n=1 Tax=Salinibacter sp. TaxID=2065818 RepID=UPI0021E88F4D|nr:hypothetical protein [Salinibacter sp.]